MALSRSGLLDSSPARLSPVRSALRYFKLVPLTSTFRSNPSRCSDFKSNVKLNQTRVHTGEASKFVAVSAVRFSVLEISASALSVRVAGSPGETVQVGVAVQGVAAEHSVSIPAEGFAQLRVSAL